MYERLNWKLNLIAGGVVLATFATLASSASAQIGIYIGRTPPPMRYEVRPEMPGEGYVWTDGYWGAEGGRYVWRRGSWQRPPYEGGYWSHPHYDHYQQGWRMHEGHWDHEDRGDRGNHRDERRR